MTNDLLILASNCKIITGHLKSILIDLQNQELLELSDWQFKLLKDISKLNKDEFIKKEIDFINSLIKKDVILKVPKQTLKYFKELNNEFENDSIINNSIVRINNSIVYYQDKLISNLNSVGCKFIEIRILDIMEKDILFEFLSRFKFTTIQSIDVFIPFNLNFTQCELINLQNKIFELRWIFIYSTPKNKLNNYNDKKLVNTLYLSHDINSKNCGVISSFYFAINIAMYTESLNNNTCLNCKISVDENGVVTNCPSIKENLGNLQFENLNEILLKKKTKKYWNITKDMINVCKDCEFRHICTDCRAFLEDQKDIYSKPFVFMQKQQLFNLLSS